MCGRFTLAGDIDFYADYFGAIPAELEPFPPTWNVAPTDSVYVVAERKGTRRLEVMQWGLVPAFANATKTTHINARRGDGCHQSCLPAGPAEASLPDPS